MEFSELYNKFGKQFVMESNLMYTFYLWCSMCVFVVAEFGCPPKYRKLCQCPLFRMRGSLMHW